MTFKWRNILIVAGLILAVVMLIDFNRRMDELNRLTANLGVVRAEGTAVMQTQESLKAQVAFATSDAAVNQWARENKWVRPGEHVIQLEPAGNVTPTAEPISVTQTQSPPNWSTWWQLFFGAN